MNDLNYSLNKAEPNIMHIDLNSCFATVEQQARPHLRGKPIAVTNRLVKSSIIIAASYEAKALGIKTGMAWQDAKELAPNLIMLETDPPKYHYVYQKLLAILKSYSPEITMKSIDEGVIDFNGTLGWVNQKTLTTIGYEIKDRLKYEVGCWVTCNVGIATNRFLAKVSAGLHKPDGLDVTTHSNLRDVLGSLKLTDLPGIADHYEARLKAYGIHTPLMFLDANPNLLKHSVFKSVVGLDWHQRLRGWEVDGNPTKLGSIGRQFVLDIYNPSDEQIYERLAHLSYSTAMKLRYKNVSARGMYVYARFSSGDFWYARKKFKTSVYTDKDIFRRALLLFKKRPGLVVKEMGVTCYGLEPSIRGQASLFEELNKEEDLTKMMDDVNGRYGNFTVTFANAHDTKSKLPQKIPFGSTAYLELLCSSN